MRVTQLNGSGQGLNLTEVEEVAQVFAGPTLTNEDSLTKEAYSVGAGTLRRFKLSSFSLDNLPVHPTNWRILLPSLQLEALDRSN